MNIEYIAVSQTDSYIIGRNDTFIRYKATSPEVIILFISRQLHHQKQKYPTSNLTYTHQANMFS